jgi:crotonobetainyl-CoA:carnitine CoA-transferase CaiB-like acyl-CoA transferase
LSAVLECDGENRWLAVSCRDEAEIATMLEVVRAPVLEALGAVAKTRDRDFLAEALQQQGVAAAPVYPAEECMADDHLLARDYFVEVDHPVVGRKRYLGGPIRWHDRPREFDYRPAPLLGQHTDEVLREVLGLGETELQSLRESGVTGDDPRAI